MEAASEGQQHPLSLYLKIWLLLFVLSAMSYAVDYLNFHGYLRWGLILTFMFLKAGFIVAIFMHMVWERMALAAAILLPPLCLIVFIAIMSVEADFTWLARIVYFGHDAAPIAVSPGHH